MKVSMISLGCCKNQIDAEMMLSTIQNGGFELCGDVGDVVIINTCGFIQPAKEEAIENILEMAKLKEEDRVKAIIVTGCMAERYKEQILEEMPEVDAVVG
ncbi:MAG: 30S ribosomal protein S12 methylthiotransferase RimO, partial [Oscillospiraceae bacterium]